MDSGHVGYRTARKIVVAVIGGTVILTGVIMLFTPGPGSVVIAAGLGLLSLEFYWARRWLRRLRRQIRDVNDYLNNSGAPKG